MDRRRRYGAVIEGDEIKDLEILLGKRPKSLADGFKTFDELIESGDFQDQVVIDYLLRRAYREEWLYMPAVNLYPDRNWAAID
jgi:hypothetical protein